MAYEIKHIVDDNEKTRVKCPKCYAFICEVKPALLKGQTIVAKCKKCNTESTIKR